MPCRVPSASDVATWDRRPTSWRSTGPLPRHRPNSCRAWQSWSYWFSCLPAPRSGWSCAASRSAVTKLARRHRRSVGTSPLPRRSRWPELKERVRRTDVLLPGTGRGRNRIRLELRRQQRTRPGRRCLPLGAGRSVRRRLRSFTSREAKGMETRMPAHPAHPAIRIRQQRPCRQPGQQIPGSRLCWRSARLL